MKKLAPLAAACALALGAAACSSPQTWQVVGVSTDPGLPSALPADAAGAAAPLLERIKRLLGKA